VPGGLHGRAAAAVLIASAFVPAPVAHATFLGADGRIAFTRSPVRTAQNIYSIIPSGHGLRRVTSGNVVDFAPSWAPSGTVLAFSRLNSTGGLDVFTVGANGSGLSQVTHGPQGIANGEPAWSPDGRSIAFTRGPFTGSGPSELYRMRLDGTGLRQLTRNRIGSRTPAWTNGLIAYVQGEPPHSSIWTMRPDGTHKRRLTGLSSATGHPDFSPTGSQIAFDRLLPNGSAAIYVMDRDGRHVRRITGGRGIYEDPVFSPNGTLIAFAAGSTTSKLSIYTVSVEGGERRRVTVAPAGSSLQPAWQPVLIAPV
jgi:Tol biopolymer transport system component